MRPIVRTEEDAKRELDPRLPPVLWREVDAALPFHPLGGDRFEIFCYLLLKREHPEDEILYYGKTGDSGRDIVRYRADGSVELIQCKSYGGNVGVGEIRKELAKLFSNLHSGEIPIKPVSVARISFYASPDLTADAKDLLRYPEKWREVADKALTEHLGEPPSPDLLQFALTWWPKEGVFPETAIDLTQRTERQKELVEEFFRIRKVVDGSVPDIVAGVEGVVERALDRRKVLVKADEPTDRTWESFFDEVEQRNASYGYLEDWPGLTPDQRFEPPREYPEILEAVQTQPVTFLIGPPAAGKTFIVLQMLWDAYQQGRRVLWIAPDMSVPTDGPIPSVDGLHDMKQRIKNLTYRLGIKQRKGPLDHHEFIATNLEPNSLVYIEDPFGKRDDEFDFSLHTYSFFHLDEFVRAINGSAAREGCRIVISSREGLFDRWLDERRDRGIPTPSALFRLSGESYGDHQLENLAVRLARARGFDAPEEIAAEISCRIEYPYEVESILRALPLGADPNRVAEEVEKYRNGLKEALRRTLVAEVDPEILFLVILASGCRDPKTWYLRLHEGLGLSGEAKCSLEAAVERYRAFIIRRPVSKLYIGEICVGPDADEEFSPSHSSVGEAISEYLKSRTPPVSPFLDRLANVLVAFSEDPPSLTSSSLLATYLLSLGFGIQAGPAQDSIATILFDRGHLSLDQIHSLMRMLASLDEAFKERLFSYFKVGKKPRTRKADNSKSYKHVLLVEMSSALSSVDVPAEDAWRILWLLLQSGDSMMRSSGSHGLYTFRGSWSYLMKHLQEAPPDLLLALEKMARNEPERFVYMMAEALVEHWGSAPGIFKFAFLQEDVLENPKVQERALESIALHWETVPKELRELFLRQARHENPRIREKAATAASMCRREDTGVLEQIFVDAARDPDVSVPLNILDSLGRGESDERFARALLERADSRLATEVLYELLEPTYKSFPQWKLDFARDCIAKGGDCAESALAFLHFREDGAKSITDSLRQWRASIAEEPEPIRLGALWVYGRWGGQFPALMEAEVIALIEGLGHPYRGLALAYLSAHSARLPQSVCEYIESLESVQGSDGEAVRTGKEHQGVKEINRPWRFLPLFEQENPEDPASAEHPS